MILIKIDDIGSMITVIMIFTAFGIDVPSD